MAGYSQADRRLTIDTPLGPDVLLLTALEGHEGISELFEYRLELQSALGLPIPFDKLLAQPVTVAITLPGGLTRYIHGIVQRFSEVGRDAAFTHYRAVIVPAFWMWTQSLQSRIFQQMSTPDILKAVFDKLRPNVRYQLTANYHPRDFTVQYQETDFAFASRLMETEGIYYFFEHEQDKHTLVVTDAPVGCPDLPAGDTVPFAQSESAERNFLRVDSWEKTQEIRSNKFTLWDFCFEMPTQNLQSSTELPDEAKLGLIDYKLKLPNVELEDYRFPGLYAKRYDGVSSNGSDQSSDLQHNFEDKHRLATVRAQQSAARSLTVSGTSNCGQFTPGYKFKLMRHLENDGEYLLTRVE
ncbi:MAG: type VI secretion system Vgr family protein, partial [Gemmataceae bacterium]